MKTKLLALSIFAATAVTVTFFPTVQQALANTKTGPIIIEPPVVTIPIANEHPKIEMVFVLDTTGSMSGLIDAAKEKIWSIASTMASAQTAPDIKIGLVAYRDRGDAYVTKTVALSNDLDSMYATLMDFKADGGGDTPESVNQGLYDAVNNMSWSTDQQTYKVVFLVGDAPAHMDYQNDVKYPDTMIVAKRKGIIINSIQAGQDSATTANWQQVARLGNGDYFQVESSGNAVAIATPFDKTMAELSAKLDDTRLYYGNEEAQRKQALKVEAANKLHKEASDESLARRATFNATKSGKANFLGNDELVDAITSGRVELADIPEKELPASIQAMAPEEQVSFIAKAKNERNDLEQEMKVLAKKRDTYLHEKVAELDGAKDSFDSKIYSSIKAQAEEKGLIYDDDSAKY
ncbi:MAG: vWA domain-containing protein [Methylophagaceae bacterium]